MRLIDRVGQRYDRLVVVARAPNKSASDTNARWACQCDCGRATIAYGQDLARGKVRSCGCWNAERIQSHGMSRTRVYIQWSSMKQRVTNEKAAKRHIYAGLEYDPSWETFEKFYEDMGDPPTSRHTLDRIDGTKGYSKGNCRWATYREQNLNTSRNHYLEWNGKRQTITEWAEELKIPRNTLFARVMTYGWDAEKALTTPVRKRSK